jgi:transposase-like protein
MAIIYLTHIPDYGIVEYMKKTANADPLTLQQAIAYFADPQKCFDYAVKLRWPDGKVTCPRCGSDRHSFIKTRRIWFCNPCKKQFTLKVGTIFEDSPMGMDKWMAAFWMLVNCRNGISSCEVARDFGITQKSAWFMLHRLRLAMQNGSFIKLGALGGEVEVDESFIGGKVRNMHRGRKVRAQAEYGRMGGKTVVLGMLERGKEVRATVIPDRTSEHMQSNVLANVHPGAEIFSDEFASSWRMDKVYDHKVVNHLEVLRRRQGPHQRHGELLVALEARPSWHLR